MKTRTTLLLLILVVVLGVWIKFFESKTPNTATAKREAGNVVNFDRAKLEGITIQNGDDRIELRQQAGKWRLTAPVKDQADGAVVDNLISDLEAWRKESSIAAQEVTAEKGRMAEFGLVQPKLRLRLSGPEMPPEIWFGKDTAFEGQMYVRFADAKDVYIAPQTVRTDIAKKADEFRDRKLTDLATAQVTRVVLKSAAGEIELGKKNEHWEIVKPLQARGDDQKIGDLIAQVTNARIQEFVADDKGDLQAYGLSDPRGSITIYGADDKSASRTDSSGGEEGSTLQLGAVAAKIEDAIYVRYLPRHAVYALPKKTVELLAVRPNDLRDRHLVRLDTNNLDRLSIEAIGQPKIVLARKDQNWTLASRSDQPANGDEVRRLLDALNNQEVARFVADTASELPKYGLDQPQVKLTFSSFASENTAETKAGEQPFLSLSLGKIEGNEIYARIGEEPFIVAVHRALLDQIWIDPLRWQALPVFSFKPDDIHRVSRVTDREESVVRNGPKDWKWVQGSGEIDTADLQSLLNTLASLRAVRWAGATTPAHGFDKPLLVLTFTTSPDDKALHKLTIGNPTEDQMWFARIDGRDGTFVVNQPDLNAFRLPLAKAAPAPSPTAPPVTPAMSSPVPASSPNE
ncbi:MAG: DUF4340 domain-containing protein [Verrucomicrobiota bacterium]|nr:DUF4340 domain-containing protein [Verrucomicrobiota bacterium]